MRPSTRNKQREKQKQDEELSKIVSDSVQEMEEKEKPMEICLKDIYKEILKNRSDIIDIKNSDSKTLKALHNELSDIREVSHSMDKKLSKKILLFWWAVIFLSGIFLGWEFHENKEDIKPYADSILNVGGKVVEKAVTHGMGN